MGLRKGQASKAFLEGKMEKYNLKNMSPEERTEFARKGANTRWEKERKRKAMKEQLCTLLCLDVKSKKGKELLEKMGISPEDCDNQMLLMAALLNKGFTGDVQAIKQIFDIVNDNTEEETQASVNPPVINIFGVSPKNITIEDNIDDWDEQEDWE